MAYAMDSALIEIERKVESGIPLSMQDGLTLYRTHDLHNLGRMARAQKERKSGRKVFYVLNRYINSTNVCYANCKFCSFAADEFKESERVFRMTAEQVFGKAIETGTNFNQIHIVGGHDPRQLSLDYWLPLMRRFKEALPHVQLSLFTAAEIEYMAKRHRMDFQQIVRELKAAGLDNVNGGAAEIFAEETRAKICANKVSSENWLALHEELHRQGVASNATMLYGHIESIEDRVDHLIRLRESQKRSPGFNAFIPLAFHPDGNELSDCGWTTGLDDLRTFAVARLMLENFDHIKAYWMIQGLKICQVALQFGADDMDGTHGSTDEEMIYHAAGTQSGQHVDDRQFRALIEDAGYVPVRRNSTYEEFPFDWSPPAPPVSETLVLA
ncbi:MAG: CofH family radical SAM protein [Candidatus Eremiobacteraeota bacterium]|nr:CofH family radical SAM protein [Candidatus Eremiobacteraeota bacterium]